MADARRYTGGKYLKAAHIDRPVQATISGVFEEIVGEDKEEKLVVYFRELGTRGLALNATNTETLIELYGPDTDGWKGRGVEVYSVPVQYAGKTVQGIRLRGVPVRHHERREPLDPGPDPDADGGVVPF